MSNETFAVGEIAAINNPDSPRHGMHCVIVAGLKVRGIRPAGKSGPTERLICYRVELDGKRYNAEPHKLRKLRPPRDDLQAADPAHVPFWNLISKVPA